MNDDDYAAGLRATMSELTAQFARPTDIATTLSRVTHAAVELLDGVDYADVLLITGPDEFQSIAATNSLCTDLDDVQQRFQEGPCLDAALDDVVTTSNDLDQDDRWPGSPSPPSPPACTACSPFGSTPTTTAWAH